VETAEVKTTLQNKTENSTTLTFFSMEPKKQQQPQQNTLHRFINQQASSSEPKVSVGKSNMNK
jgi:hypothetical protein